MHLAVNLLSRANGQSQQTRVRKANAAAKVCDSVKRSSCVFERETRSSAADYFSGSIAVALVKPYAVGKSSRIRLYVCICIYRIVSAANVEQ